MSALVLIGISLLPVIALAIVLRGINARRVRRRDETPEARYKRTVQDVRRVSDGPPPIEPTIWPSTGGGSGYC
jgi:hypothetical protein